jgi:hypothetical protein
LKKEKEKEKEKRNSDWFLNIVVDRFDTCINHTRHHDICRYSITTVSTQAIRKAAVYTFLFSEEKRKK